MQGVTYHEHHTNITGSHRDCTGTQNEGCGGENEWQDDVVVPFSRTVRMPRVDTRNNEAQDIRGGCEKECFNVTKPKRFYNRGKEVGDRTSRDNAEYQNELYTCQSTHSFLSADPCCAHEQTYQNPGLYILKRKLKPDPERLILGTNPVILANIFL